MSTFNFLNSLLNPPAKPIVEEAMPTQEAPAPTESVTVDEVEMLRGGSSNGIPHSLNTTYSHPSLSDPLYLTVHAVLDASYEQEDSSFDYEYGSERGIHSQVDDVLEDLAWKNVTIPQIADNMDLFKMSPEQVAHVTAVVARYVQAMDESEIEQLINVERVVSVLKPRDIRY